MSERRNLWIGLLLGMLLTGLLMFMLNQQAGIAQIVSYPTEHATEPQSTMTQSKAATPWMEPELSTPPAQLGAGPADTENTIANEALTPQQDKMPEDKVIDKVTGDAVTSPTPAVQLKTEPEQVAAQSVLSEVLPAILPGELPEGLDLSAGELQQLSDAERAEYQALLASYQEVREQVLRLHEERGQLKQRIDAMFEQNEVMELELDKMREAVRSQSPGK